jgi:hypothetical protein
MQYFFYFSLNSLPFLPNHRSYNQANHFISTSMPPVLMVTAPPRELL